MEPLNQPTHQPLPIRLLAALVAALVLVLGLLYLGLWFFSNNPFANSGDEKKLQILSELQIDSKMSDEQKADALSSMGDIPGATVSKEDKLDALSGLRQQ